MPTTQMLCGMILGLLLLLTPALALVFRKISHLSRELAALKEGSTTSAQSAPPGDTIAFSHDLALAEIRKQLQVQPRTGSLPDKYRYVASLVKNGLEAEQVAEVLNLGRGEAEQLVTLALLADRKHQAQTMPSPNPGVRDVTQLFAQLKERAA